MTDKEKEILIKLISKGDIKNTIEKLLTFQLSEEKQKEALAIAGRFERLQTRDIKGTISLEEKTLQENQIIDNLLNLVKGKKIADSLLGEKSDSSDNAQAEKKEKRSIGYIIGILGSIASIIGLLLYFLPTGEEEAPQLTIYITDIEGNVVLEHEAEINTSIGNRPMRETIGANGRINFGDILPQYLGDSITIGLKAEGWEMVNSNKRFLFEGKPIQVKVRKDNSLGIIKGVVKTRDGQNFISQAKVLINADTSILTNEEGLFKIILPEEMRVEKENDSYLLTVSKDGYKTESTYHHPKSSDAEIRLISEN